MTNDAKERILLSAARDIQALKKQQDKVFSRTLRKLRVRTTGQDSNILFDTLFNGENNPKMVVNKIWPVQDAGRRSRTRRRPPNDPSVSLS